MASVECDGQFPCRTHFSMPASVEFFRVAAAISTAVTGRVDHSSAKISAVVPVSCFFTGYLDKQSAQLFCSPGIC